MEKRKIGSLDVTVVGLGCNNFGGRLDAKATADVVTAALDAGINFFDTADMYGGTLSEEYLGAALRSERDQVIIATKFGHKVDEQRRGAKADYVLRAVEDSLRRLNTDRIDLYQLHIPDPDTPISETLAALDSLVKSGKVREIGCSNFSVEQLREAEAAAKGGARFVSVQNEYSLLNQTPEVDGVLDECHRLDLAFLPYFPLASGLLSGKYRRSQSIPEGTRLSSGPAAARWITDERLIKVETLLQFAESRGRTLLELAISWLLSRTAVASVIAGATRREQVCANASAAGWQLTPDELLEIDQLIQ